jgi:ankyrin repeat protein
MERYTEHERELLSKQIRERILDEDFDINFKSFSGYTPIYVFLYFNEIDNVKLLLDNKADVNINKDNKSLLTPLETALLNTDDSNNIVELLIEYKADLNVIGKGNVDICLHKYVIYENEEMCELLLKHKIGVNMEYQDTLCSPIHGSVYKNNIEITKLLLKYKANIESISELSGLNDNVFISNEIYELLIKNKANINSMNDNGVTLLSESLKSSNFKLAEILLKNKADVNLYNMEFGSPLHICTSTGNINMCELLLESKANVNILDNFGASPLNYSVISGNIQLCELLLNNGADINKKFLIHNTLRTNDLNMVEFLLYKGINKNNEEMNHFLVKIMSIGNKIPLVILRKYCKLLIENKANVYGLNNNIRCAKSPMIAAITFNNFKSCKILIENGFDIHKINQKNYEKILEFAFMKNNFNICELLINSRGDHIKIVNGAKLINTTIINNNLKLCKLLIKYKADVNGKHKNCSSLYTASKLGNMNFCKLLIKNKADINLIN